MIAKYVKTASTNVISSIRIKKARVWLVRWASHARNDSRDLNGDLHDDESKRQRTQYNGDQLYTTQMWPKWPKQDELKAGAMVPDLTAAAVAGGAPYTLQQFPTTPEQAFTPVVTTSTSNEHVKPEISHYDAAMSAMTSQVQSSAVYSPPLGKYLLAIVIEL
ncbi:paired box protein Pax-2a [Trichonephila inaurata madagascariensis]|uniref:Paired box protein Pax-2a n=1 Tax=Trichonephila inaurata madagascariensis TaxID=2747483 RepID=A0A8X6YIU7_9ARAC|nr:paired box protein Pax-2a [Trichonephila inaurata madagascariensis]